MGRIRVKSSTKFIRGSFLVAAAVTAFSIMPSSADAQRPSLQELLDRTAELEEKLANVSVVEGELQGLAGPHLIIEGANLHVRNETGSSFSDDARGNLILGWNEQSDGETESRIGSHCLVMGPEHSWTQELNIVAGVNHNVTDFCNLVVGEDHTVSANECAVFGEGNTASNVRAFVSGHDNTGSGAQSFVGGGTNNTASGVFSFVGGGTGNTADGESSFIAAGQGNDAAGLWSFAAGRLSLIHI